MTFHSTISPHEYKAGTVFDDATCYGAYIEVGSDETYEWFREQGLEGNGCTILALVDSLCKLELKEDTGKYRMEAEAGAENTWVYGREKAPIDRLLVAFDGATKDEASVKRLVANASDDLME
jgi:hypothetical protein